MNDVHRKFILQRREIQAVYLDKPHRWKEFMLFLGAAIAFLIAWPGLLPFNLWGGTPYAILIVVMFLNEVIVSAWRRQREQSLITVKESQIRSDISRLDPLLERAQLTPNEERGNAKKDPM